MTNAEIYIKSCQAIKDIKSQSAEAAKRRRIFVNLLREFIEQIDEDTKSGKISLSDEASDVWPEVMEIINNPTQK